MEAEARAARGASKETEGYSKSTDRAAKSTENLEKRAKGLESQAKRTERAVDKLDKTVGRIGKWGAITAGVSQLAGLIEGLGAGAIALLPRLGDLAGAGTGLASAYIGAGAAMGTFKLATSGVSEALKGNKKALADLTPEARGFVQELKGMDPLLDKLRTSAQKGLFGGAGNLLDTLKKQAPAINQIVASTSSSLGGLLNFASGQVSQPGFMKDLGTVVGEGNKSLDAAGKSAMYLAEAFMKVMVAAKPLLNWMDRMAVRESKLILQHAKLGQESDRLGRYFDRTKSSIQLFGQIGDRVFKGLRGVFRAASGSGDVLWKSIDRAAGRFDRWANSFSGQASMRRYFRQIVPELRALGTSLGRIVKLFLDLSGGPGSVTTTLTLFGDLAGGADTLVRKLGPVGKLLGGIATTMYGLHRIGAFKLLGGLGRTVGNTAAGRNPNSTIGRVLGSSTGIVGFDGNPMKPGMIDNPIAVLVVDRGGSGGGGLGKGGKSLGKTAAGDAEKTAAGDATRTAERTGVKDAAKAAGKHALGAVPIVGSAIGAYETFRDLRSAGAYDSLFGTSHDRPMPSKPTLAPGKTGVYAPHGAIPTYVAPHASVTVNQTSRDYQRLNNVLDSFAGKNGRVRLSLRDTEKALTLYAAAAKKAGDTKYAFADRLGAELLKTRNVNSRGVKQIIGQWNQLPNKAKASAANSMLQMANRLEKDGKLPRGVTNQLRKQIVNNYDQMGKDAANRTADMSKKTGQNTKQAADSAGKNMGDFVTSVEAAMKSGVLSTGTGMNLLLTNLNRALTKVGAKPLGQIQVVMMQNLATGKTHSIPGHGGGHAATGALMQIGRPGTAGPDNVPMSVGGRNITVGEGEQVAVINRHQQPVIDRALMREGYAGLGGLFNRVRTPNYMASGGAFSPTRYAGGGVVNQVDSFFRAHGFDKTAIAGILGNAWQESGGNPNTPGGGMWQQISNFGSGTGGSLTHQMQVMLPQIMGLRSQLNAAGGPGEAAQIFEQGFEKAGIPAMANRIRYAQEAFAGRLGAGLAGGGGAASWTPLKAPHVGGHGAIATTSNAALRKATAAANQYGQQHMPQPTMGGGGGGPVFPVAKGPVPPKVQWAKQAAQHIAARGLPYGHDGAGWNEAAYDCSSYVSTVMDAAGIWPKWVYYTAAEPINQHTQPGPGKWITIATWGSSGQNAHTMMEIDGHYFESGGHGGGPHRDSGWSQRFDQYRHPAGFARGGIAANATGAHRLMGRVGEPGYNLTQAEADALQRQKIHQKRHGGAAAPMSTGGVAWGGWHANGVDMTVNRPTIFGAGERGVERVQVTPSGHSGGGHTIHIGRGAVQVNAAGGSVKATQQYVEKRLQQFAEEVAAEIANGAEEDESQVIMNGR